MSANLTSPVMPINIIDVAVGVLCNDAKEVLFAQRPEGKPMAGYWEFPGGKLEQTESVHQALARELHEEIGIDIGPSHHWRIVEHVYAHAHVRLHFQVVRQWSGTPVSRENQALHWQHLISVTTGVIDTSSVEPVLPATLPLLSDLAAFVETLD